MGGEDDHRDLRDRIIRLEEQMKVAAASLASHDRKMWAVIGLVMLTVGKRLVELIGITP